MPDKQPLRKNTLTYLGGTAMVVAFGLGVILILSQWIFESENPYSAIVTYMVIPTVISLGGGLALLGMFIEWRRRKSAAEGDPEGVLPVVDFNKSSTRRNALYVAIGLTVFFGVSAVATYKAFLYTESVEFCGTTCHAVMAPEYVAYQMSPHARVSCAECHIGAGADWYARSKISGLRQVWRTIMGTYEMPIETPVHNLRPARETCQECHWPQIYSGSKERISWNYWYDEENTPSRYNMLMHVGGASPEHGEPSGIHWHISEDITVRYWARDRRRLDIPWVEVTHENGETVVYRSDDAPEERPPESEIREMDCIDCHNRPTHVYYPPHEMVNRSLTAGRISRDLPSVKANAVEWLRADYSSYAEAREVISSEMRETYLSNGQGAERTAQVEDATAELIRIYEQTHFPEQGVDWQTYPDHIGHLFWPGCFRCHNDEHEAQDGSVISMDCSLCHDFVFQAHGDEAYGPVVYESEPFEHPDGIPDMHEGMMCTDCHGIDVDD